MAMKAFLCTFFLLMIALPTLHGQDATDCPCCSEEYKSFDFWVGRWKVTLADGSPAGTNHIERTQDGCLLLEHWNSARKGFTGTSFTYYNRPLGLWEHLWVDNSGNVLKLQGGPKGKAIVLSSDPVEGPEGGAMVNRITWTPGEDGGVHQLWELLRDGAVVQVLFDGYYRRAGK